MFVLVRTGAAVVFAAVRACVRACVCVWRVCRKYVRSNINVNNNATGRHE